LLAFNADYDHQAAMRMEARWQGLKAGVSHFYQDLTSDNVWRKNYAFGELAATGLTFFGGGEGTAAALGQSAKLIDRFGVLSTKPAWRMMDPREIRFTQSDASPNFSKGGTIDELVGGLRQGTISPMDLPPIQVVKYQGKWFSIDNRRLVAFNLAGVDKIPVQVVSLKDTAVLDKLRLRFDPVDQEGKYIVIATSKERLEAQQVLHQYGKIKGINL